MTSATGLHSLYKKYVTQYEFIEILERDLPPPRLHGNITTTHTKLYPSLDIHPDYSDINKVCNLILAGVYKKKHVSD
uniref:Uncharacterized protein n=1 Tax=Erinnyis ello granulovirus TaxID=307444 RepID=A0A288WIP6_9BBAC|nr:hypothetical protein EREL_074 [Erinnyis ello granulovirus]ARX72063.1 hypothetical protein EREL_074 [Erinnyis ello granulovirus]